MSLEDENLIRVGELELRAHNGHFSMEFESEKELREYLEAASIEHWIVCDRKV